MNNLSRSIALVLAASAALATSPLRAQPAWTDTIDREVYDCHGRGGSFTLRRGCVMPSQSAASAAPATEMSVGEKVFWSVLGVAAIAAIAAASAEDEKAAPAPAAPQQPAR